jgi:hypothetical protein
MVGATRKEWRVPVHWDNFRIARHPLRTATIAVSGLQRRFSIKRMPETLAASL